MDEKLLDRVLALVRVEVLEAEQRYGRIRGAHEGVSIIREEFEEFWDEVKKKPPCPDGAAFVGELKQVAAMAICTMIDVGTGKAHLNKALANALKGID